MPLFNDKTASTPMVKHTMNIGKCVTDVMGRCFTNTAVHGEEGQAYTLIFLLEFANNAHRRKIMGIDQPQTTKWPRIVRFCDE